MILFCFCSKQKRGYQTSSYCVLEQKSFQGRTLFLLTFLLCQTWTNVASSIEKKKHKCPRSFYISMSQKNAAVYASIEKKKKETIMYATIWSKWELSLLKPSDSVSFQKNTYTCNNVIHIVPLKQTSTPNTTSIAPISCL